MIMRAILPPLCAVLCAAGCQTSGGHGGSFKVVPEAYTAQVIAARDFVQDRSGVDLSDNKITVRMVRGRDLGYSVNGIPVSVLPSGAWGHWQAGQITMALNAQGSIHNGALQHEWAHEAAREATPDSEHPAAWKRWVWNWYDSDGNGLGN